MKKKVLVGLAFALGLVSLSSCDLSTKTVKDDLGNTFIEKQYSFKNYSDEFKCGAAKIDTYFKSDNKYVAYVDLEQFLNSTSSIFDNKRLEFKDDKALGKYILSVDGIDNVFDYKNQKIEYETFDCMVELQETDYSYCLETEYEYDEEKEYKVNLDLSKYDIELFHKDNKLLIEFDLLNLLLCTENLYVTVFNGSGYFGDFYFLSDELQDDAYTQKLKETPIPSELKVQDGKYLSLVMENYYGLYDYKNLDKNEQTKNIRKTLEEAKNSKYAQTVFDYFNTLDDCHTGMATYPLYYGGFISYATYGEITEKVYGADDILTAAKEEAEITDYDFNIVGNTAFISFDEFETNSDFDLDNIDINGEYTDTFIFIYTCLMKARQNGAIDNIVFDISTNGGGNIGALLRIFGFLTNDDILIYEEVTNSGFEAVSKVKVDANLDGDFTDDDAFTEFKYYILTSESSFSCANAFPTIAKAQNMATIIGQKSSGGMCSVMTYVLPSGIFFQSSSANREYTYMNGNKYYLEGGAPVDIEISYDKFYDFEYIANKLNK